MGKFRAKVRNFLECLEKSDKKSEKLFHQLHDSSYTGYYVKISDFMQ